MWLALRETFGAGRPEGSARHLPALCVPCHLVDRVWLRLLVESHRRRGGDAHGLAGLQQDAGDAAGAVAARLDAVKSVSTASSPGRRARWRARRPAVVLRNLVGCWSGPLYNARVGVRDQIASLRDGVRILGSSPCKPTSNPCTERCVAPRHDGRRAPAELQRYGDQHPLARADIAARSTSSASPRRPRCVPLPPLFRASRAERILLLRPNAGAASDASGRAGRPARDANLREAAFNEGPAGVANAIKRLWENIGSYLSSLAATCLRVAKRARDRHTRPADHGRDMIALLATIGIDLGLLGLAILNPPQSAPSRRPASGSFARFRAAIDTAISRVPGANLKWVRRHFIYHRGTSYLVIPNLYSCDPENGG